MTRGLTRTCGVRRLAAAFPAPSLLGALRNTDSIAAAKKQSGSKLPHSKRILMIERKSLPAFQRRLLAWFRRHRRDLPWRRTRDPYRIWLSEIMLQQTRVAAALPFYRRFLRRFPTVRALAPARADEVLRHWAGLGYYSRARNLHAAAKEIVARHAGRFPTNLDEALALPGVGHYTAAAVLSMAYGAPLAVLDGNVARVLARLGAIRGDLRAPRRWRTLQETAQRLLAPANAGNWNQAMMELGATVCTPRAPRCAACPVSHWCRAYALGLVEQLPCARRKPAPARVRIAAAVMLDPRGRTLLVKQDGDVAALFSRMWQFPAVAVARDARAELRKYMRTQCQNASRISPQRTQTTHGVTEKNGWRLEALPAVRHTVTFRKVTLLPFLLRVAALPGLHGSRRPLLDRIDKLPISNATRKIDRALRAHMQEIP